MARWEDHTGGLILILVGTYLLTLRRERPPETLPEVPVRIPRVEDTPEIRENNDGGGFDLPNLPVDPRDLLDLIPDATPAVPDAAPAVPGTASGTAGATVPGVGQIAGVVGPVAAVAIGAWTVYTIMNSGPRYTLDGRTYRDHTSFANALNRKYPTRVRCVPNDEPVNTRQLHAADFNDETLLAKLVILERIRHTRGGVWDFMRTDWAREYALIWREILLRSHGDIDPAILVLDPQDIARYETRKTSLEHFLDMAPLVLDMGPDFHPTHPVVRV